MTKPLSSLKNIISSLEFFSKLNNKEIENLSSISTLLNYNKDYVLHYEKENSSNLLFLIYGEAKAYKIDKHDNEIFLYHIDSSSLISEITNLQDSILQAVSNVVLNEDSQILSIDYARFKSMFLDTNILHYELTNEIISRQNQLQKLINREFIFDSVSKVAMMLDSDLEMFNKIKRSEVSLILHIQPETLSRVLSRLKRNFIIESKQGQIIILNKNELRKIFED